MVFPFENEWLTSYFLKAVHNGRATKNGTFNFYLFFAKNLQKAIDTFLRKESNVNEINNVYKRLFRWY